MGLCVAGTVSKDAVLSVGVQVRPVVDFDRHLLNRCGLIDRHIKALYPSSMSMSADVLVFEGSHSSLIATITENRQEVRWGVRMANRRMRPTLLQNKRTPSTDTPQNELNQASRAGQNWKSDEEQADC